MVSMRCCYAGIHKVHKRCCLLWSSETNRLAECIFGKRQHIRHMRIMSAYRMYMWRITLSNILQYSIHVSVKPGILKTWERKLRFKLLVLVRCLCSCVIPDSCSTHAWNVLGQNTELQNCTPKYKCGMSISVCLHIYYKASSDPENQN